MTGIAPASPMHTGANVSVKKVSLAIAGATAAGALFILGGPTLADAATKISASSNTPGGHGNDHRGGSDDTRVTGDELAKVIAAVKAKDAAVTVTSVRKDPDASYDVFATKSGNTLMYDVSADLKTITERQGGHGGRGRAPGTAVTGDELAKVTAAVKAKDSAVTVTSVRKDSDGSYHVFASKAGADVMYEVSADLKTVTERQGRHGDRGGSTHTPVTAGELAKVTAAVKANDSAVTVTRVRKDPDGSYDVFATKAGAEVRYQVSADLKTINAATAHQGGGHRGGPRPAPSSSTK
jgi:hypothetical protein